MMTATGMPNSPVFTLTDQDLNVLVRNFSNVRYYAIPIIILDVIVWISLAALAIYCNQFWLTVLAIIIIGIVPCHDILVHGHDSTHRLISRHRGINEFFLWFNHALFFIAGSSYRAFHLDHHHWTHTDQDPEVRLIKRISGGAGWGYLIIPYVGYLYVNAYPFLVKKPLNTRLLALRDLLGMLLLHVTLFWALGTHFYQLYVLFPNIFVLAWVVTLRSICEHHDAPAGKTWRNTRAMSIPRWLEILWSNTNYHVEHHLFPTVPFQKMPELRQHLQERFIFYQTPQSTGYFRTGISLLFKPHHIRQNQLSNKVGE